MAAAEAKAAWQRSANRCLFSDEVKAHLFSGCSSSSTDELDPASPVCNLRGTKLDPVPQAKWWLDLRPKNEYDKDFTWERRSTIEVDFEVSHAGLVCKDQKCNEDYQSTEETKRFTSDDHSITEKPEKISTACINNRDASRVQELNAVPVSGPLVTPKSKEVGEFQYLDDRLMESEFSKSSNFIPYKNLSCDFESDWLKIEKNEPWWRIPDKEEIASLVTQKSHEHVENCDLAPPRAKLLRNGPSLCWDYFSSDSVLSTSLDQNTKFSSPITCSYARGSTISVNWEGTQESYQSSSMNSHIPNGSFSHNKNQDEVHPPEGDLSRAQLVEALCHSQTRAREAEKAAEKAYSEKERIVTLFFRQAAELFAYRQWLQLLQLENFCLQVKSKTHPFSNIPLISHKSKPMRKRRHGVGKRKHRNSKHGLRKCAFAFAVGLGLAGAGLLFGWSMGWLFPNF